MHEENSKICKNCQFFVNHYIKRRNRFKALVFGHCIKKKSVNLLKIDDSCEKFQGVDNENEIKAMEKEVLEIAQDIYNLIQIKKADN